MQVQINSDNHIRLGGESRARIEETVVGALERFADRITRVEVHLGDENGRSKGGHDLRCTVEARVAGMQPFVASDLAPALDQAVDGALGKLVSAIQRNLDRRHDPKGRSSMAGEN